MSTWPPIDVPCAEEVKALDARRAGRDWAWTGRRRVRLRCICAAWVAHAPSVSSVDGTERRHPAPQETVPFTERYVGGAQCVQRATPRRRGRPRAGKAAPERRSQVPAQRPHAVLSVVLHLVWLRLDGPCAQAHLDSAARRLRAIHPTPRPRDAARRRHREHALGQRRRVMRRPQSQLTMAGPRDIERRDSIEHRGAAARGAHRRGCRHRRRHRRRAARSRGGNRARGTRPGTDLPDSLVHEDAHLLIARQPSRPRHRRAATGDVHGHLRPQARPGEIGGRGLAQRARGADRPSERQRGTHRGAGGLPAQHEERRLGAQLDRRRRCLGSLGRARRPVGRRLRGRRGIVARGSGGGAALWRRPRRIDVVGPRGRSCARRLIARLLAVRRPSPPGRGAPRRRRADEAERLKALAVLANVLVALQLVRAHHDAGQQAESRPRAALARRASGELCTLHV